MSKRILFGIVLTNWIVGLFFILLLPASADGVTAVDGKSYFQISRGLVSEVANLPEGPSLEFDLKFFLSSGPSNSIFAKQDSGRFDFPVSKYNTAPFFDVKQTFIHFFFTW